MLIARREPRAKASLVANSDRRRLGTTIPAMNKVNVTSISSRASEKTLCLFMVFAFNCKTAFSKIPVCDRMDSAEQRQAYGHRFSQDCRPGLSQKLGVAPCIVCTEIGASVCTSHPWQHLVTVTDASYSPIRRRRKLLRMIAEDIVYPIHGRKNKVETMVIFSRLYR
jgi:hypothetical protein